MLVRIMHSGCVACAVEMAGEAAIDAAVLERRVLRGVPPCLVTPALASVSRDRTQRSLR